MESDTASKLANRFTALVVEDDWQSEITAPKTDDKPAPRTIRSWADEVEDDDFIAPPAPAAAPEPARREKAPVEDGFTVVNKRRPQRPERRGYARQPARDDDRRTAFRGKFGRSPAEPEPAAADNYEICVFNLLCPNPKCPKLHHRDRNIDTIVVDPERKHCIFALNGKECTFSACTMSHEVTCPYGAECTFKCILRHPDGHDPHKTACPRGEECDDSRCLGVHPVGWELPLCSFNPFCTRVGKPGEKGLCDRRHTPENGTMRMLRGFCNFRTNGLPCKHGDDCPYENPQNFSCREGKNCRYLKKGQCGFHH